MLVAATTGRRRMRSLQILPASHATQVAPLLAYPELHKHISADVAAEAESDADGHLLHVPDAVPAAR